MKGYYLAFSRVNFLSLYWCFPPIILCRAVFVDRYWVNLVLSCNILVSPSMVIESFAGYSSFGWHLCPLRICMRSAQELLAFIVSGEKSAVILIGLPLYVTWPFSLTAFNILCLEHLLFWLLCDGKYFCSGPVCLEFCRLLVYSWASLSLG